MRKESTKVNSLARLYGISQEEYESRLAAQQGLCAICSLESDRVLSVDHDHESGQVRGLLCETCNFGIGSFGHDPELLEAVIRYLNQPAMLQAEIPALSDASVSARFEIPHWEGRSSDVIYRTRRNRLLRKNFGITLDQYEYLLYKGDGCCWICEFPEANKSNKKSLYLDALAVDHDHATGLVRGLLCAGCNKGIGQLKDAATLIRKAIEYLAKN